MRVSVIFTLIVSVLFNSYQKPAFSADFNDIAIITPTGSDPLPLSSGRGGQGVRADSSPQPEVKPVKFVVLPVGINIGRRNILESSFVKGYEDGEKAVNFNNWLVSFKDLTKALNLNVTTLADGQIELAGTGLIKRINPKELTTDADLGLAISISKIQELLAVKANFDIVSYSIVFEPPWLNFQNTRTFKQEIPLILEGLPVVKSSDFSFSTIAQQVNINKNPNTDQLTTEGNLTTIGTIFGGSWFFRVNQPDLVDSRTWKIEEGQYLKQSDFSDYVIGSQPTFWPSQGRGDYWGFTTVQRFGFKPDNLDGGAFTPSQRLQSNTVNRIIEGAAKPGTLVQLVSGYDNTIFRQVLVDSSGVYRFDNVPISDNGGNYKILLYANGQLANTPIEQEPIFLDLPGQLTQGTSSLIVSGGLSRNTNNNDFFGNLTNIKGGIGYRYGVSDSLTLGTGIIYDKSLLGLFDIFYQPNNIPLKVALSALQTPEKLKYNANISIRPNGRLNLDLYSNELFQSFNFNWNVTSGLSINSSGNNSTNIINLGVSLNQNIGKIITFSSLKIDSNQQLDWSSNWRLNKWNLSSRGSATGLALELNYEQGIFNLPGEENLILGYETTDFSNNSNDLLTVKWKYRSPYRVSDQRSLWEFDLGYGVGSQGDGILASVSTVFIPGLSLRFRYDGISTTSNSDSFRIEISSALNVSPHLSPGDTRFERLRSEGGILITPFLDKNNNGIRDNNEPIYTQDYDQLLFINNKKINRIFSNVTKEGILLKLTPGMYRIDLDQAGYPLDYKPKQNASAIEVVAGSYTTFAIPFIASYTVAGTVKDAQGNPIVGARVEAISTKSKNQIFSITNSSGVFYLEELSLGDYTLKVNGQIPEPATLKITPETNTLSEINLILP